MRVMVLRDGVFVDLLGGEALALARANDEFLWITLGHRNDEDEATLRDGFGIHALTLEDVWATRELPKVESFGSYTQVLVHGLRIDETNALGVLSELDLLVGRNFVIFHAENEGVESRIVSAVCANMHFVSRGPWWLAHAVLDGVVDDYVRAIDIWDDHLYELERDVISGVTNPKAVMSHVFARKRQLRRFRRTGTYQREVLLKLARGSVEGVPEPVLPYLRDVYDHFARVAEYFDGYRDLLSGLLDAHLSAQSNKMNEIVKALTLMSTVMLPLTFIAGVYGMNFEHMPELKWRYGYAFAWAIMILTAGSILYWFKKKRWM